MNVETTGIEGLLVLTPRIFSDERGSFHESFNHEAFCKAVGKEVVFVQDNESVSRKDVIRGLHFQLPPKAQGKLVHVVKGAALDIAVDLRKASPDFGRYFAIELTAENRKQLWIPAGFAHGFLSLEEGTVFVYKCDNYYAPDLERAIAWNDPSIGINWKINSPVISVKDQNSMNLTNFTSPF